MEETKDKHVTILVSPNILGSIFDELVKAESKHPNWPISIFEQVSVIAEEAGEIAKAVNDRDMRELKKELCQTAAMCIRMLKNLPDGND